MKNILPLGLIILLASCANMPNTGQGAATGGAGGALAGAAIARMGGNSGWKGAAIGAVAGTVAGTIIGNTQDQKNNLEQGSVTKTNVNSYGGGISMGTYAACPGKNKLFAGDKIDKKRLQNCQKNPKELDASLTRLFKDDGTGGVQNVRVFDEFKWSYSKDNPGQINAIVTSKKEPLKPGLPMAQQPAGSFRLYQKGTKLEFQIVDEKTILDGDIYFIHDSSLDI